MAPHHPNHVADVDAWMSHVPTHPREAVIAALETSVNTVCRRSREALDAPVVGTIVHRVLHDATMRFPALAAVGPDGGNGIQVAELRAHPGTADAQQLHEGMRFMLTEFLDVIGALTADELTPTLLAAFPGTRRPRFFLGDDPKGRGLFPK